MNTPMNTPLTADKKELAEQILSYILESRNLETAAYGIAFALGLKNVIGCRSMRTVCKEIKVSANTISWHALRFCDLLGLEPSPLMKNDKREHKRDNQADPKEDRKQ